MTEDKGDVLKVKKAKLKARAANKLGYRDLVMSTEGISINIVENATSDELAKGDLKKALKNMKEGGIRNPEQIKLKFTQNSSTTS